MAGTRTTRLGIVFAASVSALALMMATVDPQVQYSVDELMNGPSSFQDREIFVRGVVSPGSVNHDSLTFQLDGLTHEIIVDFEYSAVPDGFSEGRTIAVRGTLEFVDGVWTILSHEIQTGCPSKYEA